MKNFRDLQVWDKAHKLTLEAYKITQAFPREELYGLTSQIRRSNASIGANIAEGCGRRGNGDFHRFLQNAMGSASELEYHILLAHDLGILPQPKFKDLNTNIVEVKRMLSALIRKVNEERKKDGL